MSHTLINNEETAEIIDPEKDKINGTVILQDFLKNYKMYIDFKHIASNRNSIIHKYRNLDNTLTKYFSNDQVEIVLARYHENLEWMLTISRLVKIYNKGKNIPVYTNIFGIKKLLEIQLPNIGRESHTYLYHIINNWDNLPRTTFFGQGKLTSDHCPFPLYIYLISKKQNITINLYNKGVKLTNEKRIDHNGKYKYNLKRGLLKPARLNFEEWWREYINIPYPGSQNILWSHGALFSVTRELIKSNSLDYYKKLISCIDCHPDPEEGHYFERAWYYIFNCGNIISNKDTEL